MLWGGGLDIRVSLQLLVLWFQCGSGFFYLSADPDPGSQNNADPDLDPSQTLPFQKAEFLHEKNIHYVDKRAKNIPIWVQKSF